MIASSLQTKQNTRTCSPFSHNYNASVFKATILIYWEEKTWTLLSFFVVYLWLEFMYFVLFASATAGCWNSKENVSKNSFAAKRKWHLWTSARTVLLSHVQFWKSNGKIHCMEKPATQDPEPSLLLEEENGTERCAEPWDPLSACAHYTWPGAWTRPT